MHLQAPKLSIIIPVYNSEKYLPECLDSILRQDFANFEIICIDDDSTDGSRKILSHYADGDRRIKILSQEHGGPGAARNLGLANAKGEYLYFMDSDDFLGEDHALSFMTEKMEQGNLDILCIAARLQFDSEQLKEQRYREVQYLDLQREYGLFPNGEALFCELVARGKFVPSVWLHCIRRSLLQRERALFMETFRWEDMVFLFKAILQAGRVQHVNHQLYVRRVREGSLMTEPESFQYVRDAIKAFQAMMDFMADHDLQQETKDAVYQHLGRQAQEIDKRFHALPKEEQKKKEALPPQILSYANMMLMMAPVFRQMMASYIFPYHLFRNGEKVVIYGAGNVGREFYEQAGRSGFVQCIGIVDKRAASLKLANLPAQSPESLSDMAYDKVLIAVQDKMLAESVRKDLHAVGVQDEKIVWDGPHYLKQDFYQGYYFPLLDRVGQGRAGKVSP